MERNVGAAGAAGKYIAQGALFCTGITAVVPQANSVAGSLYLIIENICDIFLLYIYLI